MPISAHKNFAISTLATAPSGTGGTTCTVSSGTGALFPAVPFNATVWPAGVNPTSANAEIVRVTTIAGDDFTITRAQEGTSARTHATNAQIAASITARALTDVEYGAHGMTNVKDPVYGAVGDGVTDDATAIQAALTIGGDIWLPEGTYRVASALTMSVAGTRLRGRGTIAYDGAGVPLTVSGARCLVDGIGFNTTSASGANAIVASGVECVIENIAVTGDATDGVENGRVELTSAAHRSVVRGCVFDTTFTSVSVAGSSCRVEGNTFKNYRLGVYVNAGAVNAIVAGNQFPSKAGSGITQGYDAILLEGATGASVVHNDIAACREHGIYVAAGTPNNSGISIVGNSVSGHESDGIKVLGADATTGAATDITISGNAVTDGDSTSGGITVGFCRGVVINGNTTTGQNRGIFVRGGAESVTVTGNIARRNGGSGIEIRDLSGANVGITVTGNSANDNDQAAGGFPGIYVLCSANFASTDINIRDNECSDFQGSPTQQNGITIADVTGGSTLARVVIQNNTGRNNVGALVDGAGLADITGLVIDGNYDGSAASVASASTITLPIDAPRVAVTGTTTITSVTATYSRMPVTLVFAGALTFTDGSNLKLAGDFVTTADDTITIICDGTNWYEVCRSVN